MVIIDLRVNYSFFSYEETELEKSVVEEGIKPRGLVLESVALTSMCQSTSRVLINMIINILEALLIQTLILLPILYFCLEV